jgi:arylsulfatase A-like enzyme
MSSVPNVLYLVWDDAGIATWNAFGGLVETPAMKWLAGRGLRYSQWHTPALSSPTRCSLLTGRNCLADDEAGDQAGDKAGDKAGARHDGPGPREPGVIIPPEAVTLAEVLRSSGFRTYCVGKWHLSPAELPAMSNARAWPLARGFDRFYGFLGGQTSQLFPDLVFDDRSVDPPYPPAEGYHLARDLADMAMEFIRDGQRASPGQPWLCYLSFGGHYPPHVVPRDWAEPYRGRFEMGYDRYREIALGNAKRLGLVPEDTGLAPADGHPARGAVPGGHLAYPWHALGEEAKRRSSRAAELYAGLCAYTDHQIGRLLRYLEESGQLDDTIVVACSANAPTAGERDAVPVKGDGELGGVPDGLSATDGEALCRGGPLPPGWALAFRAPYSAHRQDALGGTAPSPLIISWLPGMAEVAGGGRDQYHHAADIVPTICECAGIEPPQRTAGPLAFLDGVSMRYTFTAPDTPTARRTQLYVGPGGRAIYHDGWKAAAGRRRWELYHTAADRAETRNLAAARPGKLAELAALQRAAGAAARTGAGAGASPRTRRLTPALGQP